MTIDTPPALPAGLDRASLADPVRRALGNPSATVTTWQTARIGYVELNPVSGGLYRLWGTARGGAGGPEQPWSLVLKVARAPVTGEATVIATTVPPGWARDPSHSNYWQREALAHRSGMLDSLSDGLVAPACYGVTERPDDVQWIWLEEVVGTQGVGWDLQRYGLAARHLGRFNGAFLAEGAVPVHPWLSSDWLREWCAVVVATTFDADFLRDGATWAHPLVRRGFPEPLGEQVIRVWRERELLLAGLDRLPQTLCHLDSFSRNLLARARVDGRDETVAIDWAFVGSAAIGTDVGQLAACSLFVGDASVERASELWEAVLAGYQEGLADAGWRGDAHLVRFGASALAATRWSVIAPMMTLATAVDERRHAAAEQRSKQPIADLVAWRGRVCSFLLERAEEARSLLAELG